MKLLAISKHSRSKALGIALLIATAVFPLASSAQTVITSLPYVITEGGLYVLNSSMDYPGTSPDSPAITVNAPGVTIDLQGFYISNLSAGASTSGIGIKVINVSGVTVQNGSITGFNQAIHLQGNGQLDSCIVDNMRFIYNTAAAIVLDGAQNAIIRNCQIAGSGYDPTNSVIPGSQGIGIYDVNSVGGNLITHNSISEATQLGILLGSNDLADGNLITNTPFGIHCNDMTGKLKNNTVNLSTTPYTGGTQLSGTNF
jgi:Right handed beta helix region